MDVWSREKGPERIVMGNNRFVGQNSFIRTRVQGHYVNPRGYTSGENTI